MFTMYIALDEDRSPRFGSGNISDLKKLFAEYAGGNLEDVIFVPHRTEHPEIYIGYLEVSVSYQEEKIKMYVHDIPIDYII